MLEGTGTFSGSPRVLRECQVGLGGAWECLWDDHGRRLGGGGGGGGGDVGGAPGQRRR